jgi:hypothetical protein
VTTQTTNYAEHDYLGEGTLSGSQIRTSHETSIRQVPGLHKWAARNGFVRGFTVLDYGCGRYDDGLDYLGAKAAQYVAGYDPFNRSFDHNVAALVRSYEVVLLANVLNVIDSKGTRARVIRHAMDHCLSWGYCLVSVYEGNGSGIGQETRKGWQENRKVASYLPEIREALGDGYTVIRKGSTIIIRPQGA